MKNRPGGQSLEGDKPLLTLREVALRLRVDERTIARWIKREELASYKIGRSRRISERDLRKFLRDHWEG